MRTLATKLPGPVGVLRNGGCSCSRIRASCFARTQNRLSARGLSRFLNVVDGLIGQGLRVLVLVTTNEEIGTLHPAVARPGRSAANIAFPPLTREEAKAWLERHGVDSAAPSPPTLASLYALLEGREAADTRVVGFGES